MLLSDGKDAQRNRRHVTGDTAVHRRWLGSLAGRLTFLLFVTITLMRLFAAVRLANVPIPTARLKLDWAPVIEVSPVGLKNNCTLGHVIGEDSWR